MQVDIENIKSLHGYCMTAEFVLLLVAILIQRSTGAGFGSGDAYILAVGSIITGLLVSSTSLLSYLVDGPVAQKHALEPMLNTTLSFFLMVSAICCFVYHSSNTAVYNIIDITGVRYSGMAMGTLVFVSSIVFFIDGFRVGCYYLKSK